MNLPELVIRQARTRPDALAVVGPDTSLTYSRLDHLANRLAHALASLGVCQGDRVGIWLAKSASAVAAMQAVLRLSAVYVPLDPLSPRTRIRTIVQDCQMRALVTTQKRAQAMLTDNLQHLACLCVASGEPGSLEETFQAFPETAVPGKAATESDLAYILYTSGSTGKSKGVCISHRNALSFIEWAAQALEATAADHFANHAPFHFDLSVLDLYVAFHAGATTHLIPDEVSFLPPHLVPFLLHHAITVWYSVPSVLILMMEQAGLLDVPVSSLELRAILFAGEPFPIKYLRRLYQHCRPQVRFWNFYGPTETNVCTAYEVRELASNWEKPVPIGQACSGDRVWARSADGRVAQPGEEGELMVSGPTVMLGYWGQPAQGDKPYATGDLVRLLDDGNYLYIGRRDQQVKVRGHRIELGEIEIVLEGHPALHEAAVLVRGTGFDARLVACMVFAHGKDLSLVEMKKYCSEHLPRYMIIDEIHPLSQLPRTRNGKVDRLALSRLLHERKGKGKSLESER